MGADSFIKHKACLAYAKARVAEEERRVQKLRERVDEALLAGLETPAEEVTPEYLSSLREEAKALIRRKEAEKCGLTNTGAGI